jgi:hypothetical protein
MGRTLETIIEVDASDDDMACNANKGNMKLTCEAFITLQSLILRKEVDCDSDFYLSEKELELHEPDSELEPSDSAAAREIGIEPQDMSLPAKNEVQPGKSRKKRSLIDKAFKQQRQHAPELHSDVQQQIDPAYICLADLAADWSRYIAKPVIKSSQHPMLVSISTEDTESTDCQLYKPEAIQVETVSNLMSSNPKRSNRKKSLIDKAASRQRKELAAQCRQLELQETKATNSQFPVYCSLCEGRKNRSSCGLCGARS